MSIDFTSIDEGIQSGKNKRWKVLQQIKELPGFGGATGRTRIVLMKEMKKTGNEGANIKPLFQKNLLSMGKGELSDNELLNYGNFANIFFNADLVKQFDESGFKSLLNILQQAAKNPGELGELELRIGLGSSKGDNFSLRIPAYINYVVYVLKQLSTWQNQTFGSIDIQNLPKVTIYSAANMVAEINNDDTSVFLTSRDYMFGILKRFLEQSLGDLLTKNVSFVNDRPSSQYSGEFSNFLIKGSENLLHGIQSSLYDSLENSPMASILKTIQRKGGGSRQGNNAFLSQLDSKALIYSFGHAVYSQDVKFGNDNFESVLDVASPTSGKILMIGGPSEIPYQALRNFIGQNDNKIEQPAPIKVITNVSKLPPYLEPPYQDITLQTIEEGISFEHIKRKKMFASELSYALQFVSGSSQEEQWENYVSMFA